MTDCTGLMGMIWGHKFKARYDQDTKGVPNAKIDNHVLIALGAEDCALVLEKLQDIKQIYVHDICTRCGATIKRGDTHGKT